MPIPRDSIHRFRDGRRWCSGCWLWSGGGGFAFDEVGIPGEVALEEVLDVGRHGEAVVFAGVNDQLGRAAEALQGLIQLLAAEDRNVPVNFSPHEERRRSDAGDPIKWREFVPQR